MLPILFSQVGMGTSDMKVPPTPTAPTAPPTAPYVPTPPVAPAPPTAPMPPVAPMAPAPPTAPMPPVAPMAPVPPTVPSFSTMGGSAPPPPLPSYSSVTSVAPPPPPPPPYSMGSQTNALCPLCLCSFVLKQRPHLLPPHLRCFQRHPCPRLLPLPLPRQRLLPQQCLQSNFQLPGRSLYLLLPLLLHQVW